MTLTINSRNEQVSIKINEGPDTDNIVIPPKCEAIRKIGFSSSSATTKFIDAQELKPGVFVTSSIFDPTNPYVTFLNTTDQFQIINRNIPNVKNLHDFNIYSIYIQ